MADVAAGDRPLPEAADHLLAGDVPPALVDVALVRALVDHDRLAANVAPLVRVLRRAIDVEPLDARVRHPRASCGRRRPCRCGSRAGDRTGRRSDTMPAEAVPVGRVLRPTGGRTRWPATTRRCGTRRAARRRSAGSGRRAAAHAAKPQPVVGVEEDQVGLDPQLAELRRCAARGGGRTPGRPREVPARRERAGERVALRLVRVVGVATSGRRTCAAC